MHGYYHGSGGASNANLLTNRCFSFWFCKKQNDSVWIKFRQILFKKHGRCHSQAEQGKWKGSRRVSKEEGWMNTTRLSRSQAETVWHFFTGSNAHVYSVQCTRTMLGHKYTRDVHARGGIFGRDLSERMGTRAFRGKKPPPCLTSARCARARRDVLHFFSRVLRNEYRVENITDRQWKNSALPNE